MRKKIKNQKGSLIIKIMMVVIVGVLLITQINIFLINNFSKRFFQDVYGQAQEKNLIKIQDDFENYMGLVEKSLDRISGSFYIRKYLEWGKMTPAGESLCVYNMQKEFDNSVAEELSGSTVMLISKKGVISVNNGDYVTDTVENIMSNPIFSEAEEKTKSTYYKYLKKGFTSGTNTNTSLIGVRALTKGNKHKVYGYAVIIIPDSEIDRFYDYGESQYNNIYIMDNDGLIVSSTNKWEIGTKKDKIKNVTDSMLKDEKTVSQTDVSSKVNMILCKRIPYINYTLCFVIDTNGAIERLYDISTLIIYTVVIALLILLIIFMIIKRTMAPLHKLEKKMSYVAEGDFSQYVEISGNGEIQELAKAYNQMLDDINHYVDSIIEIQKQKRQAEIHALQMQINPHYIYNTLTSIKWLIMQGDTVKSTKAIDAFIKLLRSTISKSDEYISVEEEIENLKNYMYINEIRYGEKIKTEFFISINEPDQLMIPKMILQPFIENAFFHGFPEGQNGEIFVCVREKTEKLIVEIIDNGVGMDERQVNELENGKSSRKSEHFTGIGINNIRDRLKLIYENQYELKIKSSLGEGTTVKVVLPIQHKEI